MLKQTVTYKNFDGTTVEEDLYFNFTLLEMMEQVEVHKINERLELLTKTNDGAGAYLLFKQIVLDSFGIKSQNGRNFDKSPEIRHDLETSAALSPFIFSLLQDTEAGIAFIKGVLPEEMLAEATAQVEALRQQEAAKRPGVQPAAPLRPVQPAPVSPIVQTPGEDGDIHNERTAAFDVRTDGAEPKDAGVVMTTADKRMYTQEELDAVQGEKGTVPIDPANAEQYTDEQILAMDPQELMRKGLIMRAYQLKSQQS